MGSGREGRWGEDKWGGVWRGGAGGGGQAATPCAGDFEEFRAEAEGKVGWREGVGWGGSQYLSALGKTPDTVSWVGGGGEVLGRREKKALELLTGAMLTHQLTLVYTPFCMTPC